MLTYIEFEHPLKLAISLFVTISMSYRAWKDEEVKVIGFFGLLMGEYQDLFMILYLM